MWPVASSSEARVLRRRLWGWQNRPARHYYLLLGAFLSCPHKPPLSLPRGRFLPDVLLLLWQGASASQGRPDRCSYVCFHFSTSDSLPVLCNFQHGGHCFVELRSVLFYASRLAPTLHCQSRLLPHTGEST